MRVFFSACIVLASASGAVLSRTKANATLATHDIYQFPNETWLKNLAIRQNSHILVTVLTAPEVWQVDPFHTDSPATHIYRFPGVIGLLGIVELQQDAFYTIAGNFAVATTESTSGSYYVKTAGALKYYQYQLSGNRGVINAMVEGDYN